MAIKYVGNITLTEMTLDEYRAAKILMLEKEFMIPLKPDEKKHMQSLSTEAAIDRYARTIIQNFWN